MFHALAMELLEKYLQNGKSNLSELSRWHTNDAFGLNSLQIQLL